MQDVSGHNPSILLHSFLAPGRRNQIRKWLPTYLIGSKYAHLKPNSVILIYSSQSPCKSGVLTANALKPKPGDW